MNAYATLDGETVLPTERAIGPWGPGTMNGQVVGALLGRAAERAGGGEGWRGARLTFDLVRMATLDPLTTTAAVVRDGRRLRLVDVVLHQGGREVARARAMFVRGGPEPTGVVRRAPTAMPDPPTGAARMTVLTDLSDAASADFDAWTDPERSRFVWFCLDTPLVEGEELTGLVRACFAGDTVSPLSNWGSDGLEHINADYTVALTREPVGERVGLEGRDRVSAGGVSVATTTLHDGDGPFGIALATALATDVALQLPDR